MIRVMIIANDGARMASLTATVAELPGFEIVRHASGRTPLRALAAAVHPDLAVIYDMDGRGLVDRIREVRESSPATAVAVLTERLEAGWLANALFAGATAIAPAAAGSSTLHRVLDEALAAPAALAA